jgi:hypothetical protein
MYAEDCKRLHICQVHVVVAIVLGGAAALLPELHSSAAK